MFLKNRSLKQKIVIQLFLGSVVLISLFSYVSFSLLEDLMYQNVDSDLESKKEEILKLSEDKDLLEDIKIFNNDKYGIIVLKDGQVVYKNIKNDPVLDKNINALVKNLENEEIKNVKIEKNVYRLIYVKLPDYQVLIAKNVNGIISVIEKYDDILITLYIVTILLLNGFIYYTVDKNLKNIDRLSEDIENVSVVDLTPIDSNKYSEEFKKIIQTFNNLLNTVKELYQKQKDFIVVLSHEIKTPLTTIITDIDITLRKDREKEEYIKTLKNIHEISLYILSIFQILNKLYKTKELFYPDIKQVNVDKVVKEVLSIFSQKIKEKNLKVELDFDKNLTIQTDEVMFKEILQNIISNAVNFNKQNGTIKIKAYEENSTVKLTVSDTGVGIEEDKLEKIFDEFYKSENSEGLGLGLSIVKLYSNILGIKINIKSVVNQGTTVELTIA